MEIISSRLIDALMKMGQSHHDAKVYASLVYFNSAEAKQLIDFLQISKPSVYESLQRLQDYGLVEKKNAKPAVFTPVSPRVAIDILIRENSRASEIAYKELEQLSHSRVRKEDDETIFTVYGNKSVEHKIKEMIHSASEEIICIMGEKYLPLFSGICSTIRGNIYVFSKNPKVIRFDGNLNGCANLSITVINSNKVLEDKSNFHGPFDHAKFFSPDNLFEIIVDNKETLFIPPIITKKITGLYSDNEVVVILSNDRIKNIIRHFLSEDD